MDLWIRSQDRKRLVPNPNLYIVNSEQGNCVYIGDTLIGHIAKYATEERAIEVLNEIQEHWDVILWLKLMPNSKKIQGIKEFQKWRDSLTYEMPKEWLEYEVRKCKSF